ncbi:MAG: CHAT domain-containing protein [Saprospiraceae bacterium]|nr:CHAT domain-containing protein [Lewinella sp.]
MTQPILYFTFANQEDDHLPKLKQEIDEIKEILRPLEQREFIKLEREESTTTADIIKTLAAYPDQIAVFHYAGHATGRSLELEDRSATSQGIASLLGAQSNLQLVFLNGCSTQAQVKQLFEAGVKAVIATSVPIGDEKAVLFAATFYRALANKRSIKMAFEFAKAAVELTHRDAPDFVIQRGVGMMNEETEEVPWGLYVQEQFADAVLHWRLPYYREVGLPGHMLQFIGSQFKVNRYIVMVLDEMCRYNKDIYSQMVEVRDGEEVKKDSSTYLDLVIQNFPWLIGSQIQLLRQCNRPDRARLEQLLSTYLITGMTLYYILLSDFWDNKRQIGFSTPEEVPDYLHQKREELPGYDFLKRILVLAHTMQQGSVEFFLPEMIGFLEKLQDQSGHLFKAWQYLERIKTDLSSVEEDKLEKICLTAEQALAVLLKEAAFLADYRMLTVRNISVDNPRYSKVLYDMGLGNLNALVNTSLSLYEDAEKRRKESYSNCKSVILTPDENDLRHALNLSPFVIDKNTFLNNEHIDLFLYAYETEGKYHYLAVKHSFYLALANEKGTDIIDTDMTLEDFNEGRNINKNAKIDDLSFGDAFDFGDSATATQESPKVFDLLESQFEQLFTDLN